MPSDRYRVAINVGNLLEILGATAAVYGVARLLGLAYGLILLGILCVVAAELIYDAHVWRVPLPHQPHPKAAAQRAHKWFAGWRWDRHIRRILKEEENRAQPDIPSEILN